MNDTTNAADEFDSTLFRKNSQKYLLEQNLEPYFDKQIAWAMDGTEILASGNTHEELFRELDRLGIPLNRVVSDYIPDPQIGNI